MNSRNEVDNSQSAGYADRIRSAFVFSSALLLLATATAKLLSLSSGTKLLLAGDPIWGISFRHLLLAVAMLEIAIAAFCLIGKQQTAGLLAISWVSTLFLIYRVGLWHMDWKKPCGCMGNLTDAFKIDVHTADMVMKVILAYLLIGSYSTLFWLWIQKKNTAS
ncbi:MAG: hypothetical protein RLZZ350_2448 [Verrucomicrobiota bacterium]|jgi:hypothetical protein